MLPSYRFGLTPAVPVGTRIVTQCFYSRIAGHPANGFFSRFTLGITGLDIKGPGTHFSENSSTLPLFFKAAQRPLQRFLFSYLYFNHFYHLLKGYLWSSLIDSSRIKTAGDINGCF
ncbi:uncharacterized protein METZ01_LOCUS28537 [marine metagenome]|uniref:Uncharacterized protein n=1 Tax=marine metagenome TaxID=408172 RepID=A0A381QDD8_9ZZZZ